MKVWLFISTTNSYEERVLMRAVIKIPQMDMFSFFESSSFHLMNPARLGNEPYALGKLTQIKITMAQYIVKLK